jgi:predicted ATPase
LTGGCDVIGFLGDWKRHLELIGEATELARKHDLPALAHIICPFHEGFARIFARDFATGEQRMRQGVERWAAAGGKSELTQGYTLLAEALTGLGRYDDALADVTKAGAMMDDTGQRHWEPEIYRVSGEIHSMRPGGSVKLAEADLQRALGTARERHAKTWELRAAISLARVWQKHGKHRQARELLAPVYDWFTEGIETPDLKAARALLDGLE